MYWSFNFQDHDEPRVGWGHEDIGFKTGITAPIKETLEK